MSKRIQFTDQEIAAGLEAIRVAQSNSPELARSRAFADFTRKITNAKERDRSARRSKRA